MTLGLEPSPASALALPALPLAELELLALLLELLLEPLELLPLEPLLELLLELLELLPLEPLLELLELLPLEPLLELLELLLLELLLELPLPLGLLRLPCGGPFSRPRPLAWRRLVYFCLLSSLFLTSSVTPFAKSSSVGNFGRVCGW
jgi:hypothetical protein